MGNVSKLGCEENIDWLYISNLFLFDVHMQISFSNAHMCSHIQQAYLSMRNNESVNNKIKGISFCVKKIQKV